MEIVVPGRSTTLIAALSGATMLVATTDDDVAEFRGLAWRLQHAPDQPRAIWDAVAAYNRESSEEWRNIGKGESWGGDFTTVAERLERDGPLSTPEEAALALATLCEIWRSEMGRSALGLTGMRLGEEVEVRLFFAVANPPPDGSAQGEVLFGDPGAALVLQHGSLLVEVVTSPEFRFLVFAVGVGVYFRSPAAWSADLVERLRDRAKPRAEPLITLDQNNSVKPKLKDKRGALIFIHDLLSIDLGTFDGFIRKWRRDASESGQHWGKAFESMALCSYPHETLVGIEQNASDLYKIMKRDFTSFYRPIAFVCHGRGGVLARALAKRLYCEELWRPRIRCAVTFGTPHDGVDWAEPFVTRFLGILVLAGYGTRSFFGVFDALAYAIQRPTLEGVKDLRPPTAPNEPLLQRLGQSALQVVAIGGSVGPADPKSGLLHRLAHGIARRAYAFYTREKKHDLVVTLKSATAADTVLASRSASDKERQQREVKDCDHFSYFEPDKWQGAHALAKFHIEECLKLHSLARQKGRRRPPYTPVQI